jgi:hypothetical protein
MHGKESILLLVSVYVPPIVLYIHLRLLGLDCSFRIVWDISIPAAVIFSYLNNNRLVNLQYFCVFCDR